VNADRPQVTGRPRRIVGLPGRLRAEANTVRLRTTAAAVLVVGVALTIGALTLVLMLQSALTEQAESSARTRAAAVAAALTAGAQPGELAVADDDERFLQLLDQRGRVMAASRILAGRAPVAHPDPDRVVRVKRPTGGKDFVVASTVVGTARGPVTVLSGASLEDAVDSARVATGLLVVGVPLLLVVVGGTTWFVVGRALAPVESLRAEVDTISSHDLHRRVGHGNADDEVSRLAATMNRMLERLDKSQQRQRRFVSDASHELRSPVASIRQHAEVALAHPDRTTVPELAGTVLTEDRRIQQLIEDLLLLARADEDDDDRARHVPVDLDDLVLVQARRVRAESRLTVDLSAVSAGQVRGDPQQLARLIGNLVANGARHARSQMAISLAGGDAVGVVLRVDDDGPGIPPADRYRVFERFVRLDDARARDSGGTGLGLAIAAEVVRLHSGTIAVGSAPLGGARLEVTLPAAEGSGSPPART
jgi:signal transduction histidine kinase